MKMQTQFKVLGMKASQGNYEGTDYDNTKVYVETSLDESKGNAKGFAVAEYKFGKSDEFKKFQHLTFPIMARAEVEMVTNGSTQTLVVHSIEPIEMVKPSAPVSNRAPG